MIQALVNGFPLWALLMSAAALWKPFLFTWFSGPWITIGLGVIMLGMGVTLTVDDFARIARMPKMVLLGAFLQYTIMPVLGWTLAFLFRLPAPLAAGLILVACCPGGTASNVIAYLAKGDVPLSVTMTTLTTLMAVVMTPFLTAVLVGSRIDVDAAGLFVSTFQVVIVPVAVGVFINRYFHRSVAKVLPVAPLIAVLVICLIVSSVMGSSRTLILQSALPLIGAVFSLHAGGFLLGYACSWGVTKNRAISRTISIEVGMQNSGLGVVLARNNFSNPLVAVPCAISSLFHSLIGSALAAVWRRRA